MLPTFSEITQAWQCLKLVFILIEISTSYSVPELRYRPPYSDCNIFFYKLQNHSSATLFTLCVCECLMNIYTKFYLLTFPKLRYGPLTLNIKTSTTSH